MSIDGLYVLDRIVGGIGRLEILEPPTHRQGAEVASVPRGRLPHGCREGDVIRIRDGIAELDPEATAARRGRMEEIRKGLRKGPPGDIVL